MKRLLALTILLFAAIGCENKTASDSPTQTAEQEAAPAISEGAQGLKAARQAGKDIEKGSQERMKAVDEATGQGE